MPAKIPKSVRERVVEQWLLGMSRDEIAKYNDIGAGTVSAIIKDTKKRFLILTCLDKWPWS
jgi:transposase